MRHEILDRDSFSRLVKLWSDEPRCAIFEYRRQFEDCGELFIFEVRALDSAIRVGAYLATLAARLLSLVRGC